MGVRKRSYEPSMERSVVALFNLSFPCFIKKIELSLGD
jgi:hypothetical protein